MLFAFELHAAATASRRNEIVNLSAVFDSMTLLMNSKHLILYYFTSLMSVSIVKLTAHFDMCSGNFAIFCVVCALSCFLWHSFGVLFIGDRYVIGIISFLCKFLVNFMML